MSEKCNCKNGNRVSLAVFVCGVFFSSLFGILIGINVAQNSFGKGDENIVDNTPVVEDTFEAETKLESQVSNVHVRVESVEYKEEEGLPQYWTTVTHVKGGTGMVIDADKFTTLEKLKSGEDYEYYSRNFIPKVWESSRGLGAIQYSFDIKVSTEIADTYDESVYPFLLAVRYNKTMERFPVKYEIIEGEFRNYFYVRGNFSIDFRDCSIDDFSIMVADLNGLQNVHDLVDLQFYCTDDELDIDSFRSDDFDKKLALDEIRWIELKCSDYIEKWEEL